jgi:hypothetical protein
MTTSDDDWWHYHLFGFVVFRGALLADVGDLREECLARLTADPEPDRAADYVVPGRYAPVLDGATSWSAVADTCLPIATHLLDADPLLSPTEVQASLFTSVTRWHSDASVPCRGVKFASYLDVGSGAASEGRLRVLPLSHRVDSRPLRSWLGTASRPVGDVPATVIAVAPGDLIAFDINLWHAGVGPGPRLQWSAVFLQDPGSDDVERHAVTAWLGAADDMAAAVFAERPWPAWGLHLVDRRTADDALAARWHRRLLALRA